MSENNFNDRPQPYWLDSTLPTDYPALDEDIKVDVAIVGGGITGITSAFLLKQENLKVALIEADRIVQGATGHTTAKITSQHGLIYSKLIKHVGKEKAGLYADANEQAITFIENTINENQIDCDFSKQAAYVYTQSDQYIKKIEKEVDAASSLGISAEYTEDIPLPFDIKAAECFNNQAQFHPRKYLLALAAKIPQEGSHIFEQTRAVDFHEESECTVTTEKGHKVSADKVIIASHFPAYGSTGYYFARMYPERSYALGVKSKADFPGGMYINAENPTRSLRSTPHYVDQLIIIGGEHHKPGEGPNTNTHYNNLIEFAEQTYPPEEILYRWSTQDYTTLDEIPYTGNITTKSPDVYVATGFNKWGMTNGTASALLLKDLITLKENPWEELYTPSRFKADPMIKNFISTNINTAKHLVGDKLKPASRKLDIDPGEAKVVTIDNEKIGIYRDQEGTAHAVDITCTHMGCDLVWNEAELSWDCPCHGSRFTYEGEIIEGPALKSLRTADKFKFNP